MNKLYSAVCDIIDGDIIKNKALQVESLSQHLAMINCTLRNDMLILLQSSFTSNHVVIPQEMQADFLSLVKSIAWVVDNYSATVEAMQAVKLVAVNSTQVVEAPSDVSVLVAKYQRFFQCLVTIRGVVDSIFSDQN
jgi:hypothetical protein